MNFMMDDVDSPTRRPAHLETVDEDKDPTCVFSRALVRPAAAVQADAFPLS